MHFLIGNNNFIEKRLLRGRIHKVAWRITIENNDIKYQLSITEKKGNVPDIFLESW